MFSVDIFPFKSPLILILVGLAIFLVTIALPRLIHLLLRVREIKISSDTQKLYEKALEPGKDLWQSIVLLLIADLILLIAGHLVPQLDLVDIIELPISISASLVIGWLGYQLLERFLKIFITRTTQQGTKLNEELLIVTQWLIFSLFLFIIVAIFAETHEINIFGLIASLGVGGVAIAFAAQKTLEQLLGGIVLFLDRPFVTDDYIGLPDGTFGRVESIGVRSTKIRTSGKGTLMVVPNNYLTGINVENFSEAGKSMNITKINFFDYISEPNQSFIRQLILDASLSTEIDSRNITVNFQDIFNQEGKKITQSQVNFFVPSTGELSKEFRLQIIKIVQENIRHKLMENGLNYEILDSVWIDSSISI